MPVDELSCGGHTLDLSQPRLMGVLNITPDSFSDGGTLYGQNAIRWSAVMARASEMASFGVDLFDVGGESTRPGAEPVSTQEECDRVLPVVEKLCAEFPIIVSVDTSNPAVMSESARLGAGFINDVRALQVPGALEAVAATGLPICLMHIGTSGDPRTMQEGVDHNDWSARDIVAEINSFFDERIQVVSKAGIATERLVLDPGFGFGKRDADNLRIIQSLNRIAANQYPLLVGVSRKSSIGRLLGRDSTDERVVGGLVLELSAIRNGARIIRTHDVASSADALRMLSLLSNCREGA